MPKFMKYPSIEQFRNIIKLVRKHCDYHNEEYPVLEFTGTVKLHGTNAAIGYDPKTNEIFAQSRNNIITPENDNAGFAAWVEENKEDILEAMELHYSYARSPIYLYGEWCGGNIQKGVGITGLEKMFVIFNVLIDGYMSSSRLPVVSYLMCDISEIYSSSMFQTFKMKIDFNKPEKSVPYLQELTNQVESCCPVAREFGVDNGVGEGIVWSTIFNDERINFKVKGEKHSSSKVKVLANVDIEKLKSIEEFVNYAVADGRLQQGLSEIYKGEELTQKNTGDFVRWIANDIIKEETDVLEGNNLVWKDVASACSKKASKWYLEAL